jgi:hypothetical protein
VSTGIWAGLIWQALGTVWQLRHLRPRALFARRVWGSRCYDAAVELCALVLVGKACARSKARTESRTLKGFRHRQSRANAATLVSASFWNISSSGPAASNCARPQNAWTCPRHRCSGTSLRTAHARLGVGSGVAVAQELILRQASGVKFGTRRELGSLAEGCPVLPCFPHRPETPHRRRTHHPCPCVAF